MVAGNFSLPPGQHPFYPMEAEMVGYIANEIGTFPLLSIFFSGCAAIIATTYIMGKRLNPKLSTGDLSAMMWFVLCGFIHSFFEGYFAYNHGRMHMAHDIFGQWWKEYALSDSRYLTQDAFVLCMETVTAVFWGPGSFLIAYLILIDHPLRFPTQLIVSLGQFYGDVLYYSTSLFEHYVLNITASRPEAAYYWGYFVLMNFFWIVIPGYLMYQSVRATGSAFAAVNDATRLLKRAEKSGLMKKKA